MQVRHVLVASLLAVSAAAAMSQELDPGETLQGRSLAAQREKAAQAQVRAAESAVSPQAAQAPAQAASQSQHAQDKVRTHVRLDLTRWHPRHKAVGTDVAEQG